MAQEESKIFIYFPRGKTPRQAQVYILNKVQEAIENGYKYIVIEAPTGVGKSLIAVTIARWIGSSYIITGTKDLQDQYSNEFPFLYTIKGKSGYSCNLKNEQLNTGKYTCGSCREAKDLPYGTEVDYKSCFHKNVDKAPCVTDKDVMRDEFDRIDCIYKTELEDYSKSDVNTENELITIQPLVQRAKEADFYHDQRVIDFNDRLRELGKEEISWSPCVYYDQLNKAFNASHSVFNYSNFIIFNFMDKLNARGVTIFDECHDIENQIIKFQEITLKQKYFDKYELGDIPLYNTIDEYITFISRVLVNLDFKIELLSKATSEQRKLQRAEMEIFQRGLEQKLEFLRADKENWVIMGADKIQHNKVITLKPLNVQNITSKLYNLTTVKIFMSATVLDENRFKTLAAIDQERTQFIKVGTDFPKENRKIYRKYVGKLNKDTLNIDGTKTDVANKVNELMDQYSDVKGIVHTTSYAQLDFIMDRVSRKNRARFIITDPDDPDRKREAIIKQHKDSEEPTVLLSPSLHTGLDLRDELSRFQIIVKVPYGDLRDKWIVAKKNKDPKWYEYQTALKIIQAYGRSVRSKDDYADTYILDSNFGAFMFYSKDMIPYWFKEAVHYGN